MKIGISGYAERVQKYIILLPDKARHCAKHVDYTNKLISIKQIALVIP